MQINVNRCSYPSELKITDIKYTKVDLPPWGSYIIRIDTNQGISGFGEVRDGASITYLKILRSRLIGENPCNIERLFRKIRQFGFHSRQAGGVSAVEIALWDIAGKAYGVPVYQMLGGKYRDRIRLYGDMHIESGRATGELLPPENVADHFSRLLESGYTVLKILSVELIMNKKGNYCGPLDDLTDIQHAQETVYKVAREGSVSEVSKANAVLYDYNNIPHPFTNMHVTEAGLDELDNYVGTIRKQIGYEVPLAIDHFGHYPLPDMIKIAKRLEKYNLAWLEDMLPWYMTEQYAMLKQHTTAPLATGEDIYLAESFEPLLQAGALDLVHPDILTIGGISELKKLGDLAQRYNTSMVVHCCESPIACMAAAHALAATENVFALEHDSFDMPWWEDLVEGPDKPIDKNGHIIIEAKPGIGIERLNDEVIREHGPFKQKDVWLSTDEWAEETSLDRLWS